MTKKTPPVKVDPRVRRTHRLLQDALVSLILEKDHASISIKEITERADVAYITFYRHFESLDQLLMEVLDEGLAELLGHIETLAQQSETSALETEGRLIFEYIGQKADLFRILFKSQSVTRAHGFPDVRVFLREFGTAFDVGEEEGDGAGGKVLPCRRYRGVGHAFSSTITLSLLSTS